MKQLNLDHPSFSIIIPVYNTEKYLSECLDSVLSQTFEDFELLLIDDGSSDNSGKICDEYARKDGRISVFHQENRGLSDARNRGLDNAKGEYVVFADSDDLVMPQLLEAVYEQLRKGYDLVSFGNRRTLTGGLIVHRNSEAYSYDFDSGEDLLDYLLDRFFPQRSWNVWAQAFRRSLIGTDLRFHDNREVYAEDMLFSLCYLTRVKRLINIPQELYVYEVREGSQSQMLEQMLIVDRWRTCIRAFYDHLKAGEDNDVLLKDFPIIYFFMIRIETDKARSLLKTISYKELRKIFNTGYGEFDERMLKELPKHYHRFVKAPNRHATLKSLNMLRMLGGSSYLMFRVKDLLLDGARTLLLALRYILKGGKDC